MKRVLFFIFLLFILTTSISLAFEEDFKTDFLKNYNPTTEQEAFVNKLTSGYKCNIDIVKKIIEEDLLDDCMKSAQINQFIHLYPNIYYVLRTGGKGYTRKEINKIYVPDRFVIKINDKYYNNLLRINLKKITKDTDFKVYSTPNPMNKSEAKKCIKFQDKYHLDSKTLGEISRDTNNFKATTKYVEIAINEGLYDDYKKVFGTTNSYNSNSYHKHFKQQYTLMKKLLETNRFNYQEIGEYASYSNISNFIEIDGDYYKNIKNVPTETLANAKTIDAYSKKRYQSIKKLKQYKEFQKKYNLDENTMLHVWYDTKKLNINKKFIESGLNDNSYHDYYNHSTWNDKDYHYRVGSGTINYTPPEYFKQNYKTYLLLKNSELNKYNRQIILNTYGTPAYCVNPKYWGNKEQKVKKVLNNKKLSTEKKCTLVKDKIEYRAPTSIEFMADITNRVSTLVTCGLWWILMVDAGIEFIHIKF